MIMRIKSQQQPQEVNILKPTVQGLFSWKQILLIGGIFIFLLIITQKVIRYLNLRYELCDCPWYWPISIFNLRIPTLFEALIGLSAFIVFVICLWILEKTSYRISLVFIFAYILIVVTTLTHGIQYGFYAPISANAQTETLIPYSQQGQEYFHEAIKIDDPIAFYKNYNEIQPSLSMHAHTHPPGAVLTIYFLYRLLGDPALISIAVLLIALVSTMYFFYKCISSITYNLPPGFAPFLLTLLPAISIYYLATIDAIIAALMSGIVYFFCFAQGKGYVILAMIFLIVVFHLTFVSLFILPVLVGYDLLTRRSLKRSFIVMSGLIGGHLLLYLAFGYNPIESFHAASIHENPEGFMLFVDPVNYLFTRLEGVAEILLFFGPFMLILFIRSIKTTKFGPHDILTILGCLTVFAMFAVGTFRTGETARALIFIYPFLLFPIVRYLNETSTLQVSRMQIAILVFSQTLCMQLFGFYHW